MEVIIMKLERIAVVTTLAIIVLTGLGLGVPERSSAEALVVGRITGTTFALPPDANLSGNNGSLHMDRFEVRGFYLRSMNDGTSKRVYPGRDGSFQARLPAGDYQLIRKRNRRPRGDDMKEFIIMDFTTRGDGLVNLGSLEIALSGEDRRIGQFVFGAYLKTVYVHSWRYERADRVDSYTGPLRRLSKGEYTKAPSDRVNVTTEPSAQIDSERMDYKDYHFRWDRY
jgi:hypothetical protein